MKFKVKYSRLAHHFFYLQNMSLWRPWCHKEYNEAWIKIIGSLLNEEQKAIQELRNILLAEGKYGELFDYVFNKGSLPPDDKIRQIFKITEKSFKKTWNDVKDDLPKTKKNLNANLKNQKRAVKETLKILKRFYSSKHKASEQINVHLILLPSMIKCGGGKFGGKNNIVLEGNFRKLSGLLSIEIVLHEMIHLYFEDYLKDELYPKFEKEIEYHPLKETIAATLLPYGYFSREFFNIPVNKSFKNYSLIKLTENYIKRNKKIDDLFLKKCIDYIKK